MKRAAVAFLIAVTVMGAGLFAFCAYASEGQEPSAKVVAYYFHGAARCPTCYKLEQYSKEAIESGFKDELASGRLEFKAVNVEDRGNEHFVNDYQLYTKSLVISLVENGKEAKSKNLAKIWEYVGNRQKFLEYVTGEINAFLKGS